MPYREELEATYSQISALEEKIKTLQLQLANEFTEKEFTELAQKLMEEQSKEQIRASALEQSLQEQTKRLTLEQRRAVELEVSLRDQTYELNQAKQKIQRYEKMLSELDRRVRSAPTPMPRTLPSLFEHNRSIRSSPLQGDPSGVLCPDCLNAGEQVEMLFGANQLPSYGDVQCPRCLLNGWKKF